MNDLILTFVGTAHEQFYDDTLRDLEGADKSKNFMEDSRYEKDL